VPPSPVAWEPMVTRLLLPRADCDAGAGLIFSPLVIIFYLYHELCHYTQSRSRSFRLGSGS